ncbi:DUF4905 domain-containing protein [Roseivirga misakiensis]|uniref:DUF4905 domain-containing protein n=1 Tax=Roseivirga misakiensis TaxID=1563681 RepID=A0A1E5SKP4_9BACT|nr:DUF4905 domain-containing protein [Roseivirga misakiensis]OEJ99663.1 hypothetical protein BFP71_08825 [Roseivirga misakiensis]
MSEQLKPVFSHQFEQDIWEVLPDGEKLLISTRDNENLQVSFSMFDLVERKFLWKNISFEESWWISAYDFQGDVIVFQTYNDTQDIEARSVFGFDINSEEALWSIDDVKLNKSNRGMLSITPLSGEYESFTIDIKTGQEISETKDGEALEKSDNCKFPLHYESENPHFETLAKFVKSKLGTDLIGSCDYLEVPEFFAIAVNSKDETGYNLDLFVFKHEGSLLLEKPLDRELKGLASGTFFIVGQALIFVEGKRNLVFYSF